MTDEEYFECMIDMFSTKGWKVFVDEMKQNLDTLVDSAVFDCEDNNRWQYRRGEIVRLQQIINFENLVRGFDGDSI